MVRLIGHLMGDGCVSKNYFGYFNKNEYLVKTFEKDVRENFGESVHFVKGIRKDGLIRSMVCSRRIIKELLEITPSYRSGDIEIPSFILEGEIETKSIFLKSLFDDEGSVGLRVFRRTGEIKRDVHIASKSLRMVEQIKSLLEKDFQIKCNRIHPDTKICGGKEYVTWFLAITGKQNIEKFGSLIGFDHLKKKASLEVLLKSYIRKI